MNSSELQVKIFNLFKTYSDIIVTDTVDFPHSSMARLFNVSVWDEVGEKISHWLGKIMEVEGL